MFDQYPDLLTVKELQTLLKIGRNQAYQIIKIGDIKCFRIGKSIRIPKRSVIEYIERTCYNDWAVDGCCNPTEVTL